MDREHLSNDLASADRIARRYAASSRADDQQTLFLECHDTLLEQIATTHGVPPGQLRDSAESARSPGHLRPRPRRLVEGRVKPAECR